jgi:phosphoserine phosphatase
MNGAAHHLVDQQLAPGRWTPENHRKLVDCIASHAGGPPRVALFDADHTSWGGDLGDSTLVYLLQNLRLSPRLPAVLPASIDVPAAGFGVTSPGRLFPAARVEASFAAMLAAYRNRVARSADADDLGRTFSQSMIRPGGPLYGDGPFTAAYRIYTGTILALYNLLETSIGCVAYDFEDARVATSLFPTEVRAFYAAEAARGGELARFTRPGRDGSTDVLFPRILDTGPDQAALRARGRLGAYTQIAVWESLDKTPNELARIALDVWESPREDTPFHAVFPVDLPGATSPVPLDFSVDPSRFAPGARPAEGVILGSSTMIRGTRTRPEIANLWSVMSRHGVVPVIITASHVDLVRAVLDRHYGFAGNPILGMLPVLEADRYGAEVRAPVTYRTGKVDAARQVALTVTGSEETRPVLCAGDTTTDLEMLAYSAEYRLFFDRGKRPLMDLAEHLIARGEGERTLVQAPF